MNFKTIIWTAIIIGSFSLIVWIDKIYQIRWSQSDFYDKLTANGFSFDKVFKYGYIIIAVDCTKKRFVAQDLSYEPEPILYSFSDLSFYRVCENDKTIEKSNFGNAFMGALLMDEVGAVYGATTGKKTENICKSLCVKIYVFNSGPEIVLTMIDEEINKKLPKYKKTRAMCNEITDLLSFIHENR